MSRPLSNQIAERKPLGVAGASGNKLERVTLHDGRELILKRVSPEWDWISRATGDHGRAVSMWANGVFDRIPPPIDHATVGVEQDGDTWSVFMRDVSGELVPEGQKLDPGRSRRLMEALARLHKAFWQEQFSGLCGLEDRFRLLSFETARREQDRESRVADLITRSWDAFAEHVPKDIADMIFAIVERPALLAEQLATCGQTLIHGDVRLTNVGFSGDRVILVDWNERTGIAPPAVELVSLLSFDGLQIEASREQMIGDFRELSGELFEERALQLALIGGFVQLGSNFGLRIVLADDEARREAAKGDLAWWTPRVEKALETWSP